MFGGPIDMTPFGALAKGSRCILLEGTRYASTSSDAVAAPPPAIPMMHLTEGCGVKK